LVLVALVARLELVLLVALLLSGQTLPLPAVLVGQQLLLQRAVQDHLGI
jgi:hypothetical protein